MEPRPLLATLSCIAAAGLVAGCAPLPARGAAPARDPLEVTAEDGSAAVRVDAGAFDDVRLVVRNIGDKPVSITHYAAFAPFAYAPTSIRLNPGGRAPLELHIDASRIHLPAACALYFRDGASSPAATHRARIELTSDRVFLLEPRVALWTQGAPNRPATVRITNTPKGSRAVGIRVSAGHFQATLDGDTIRIVPRSTAAPTRGLVEVLAEPTPPQRILIPCLVVPAFPAAAPDPTAGR